MEIVRNFNGIWSVVNLFGQKIRDFDSFDDAFDFVEQNEW